MALPLRQTVLCALGALGCSPPAPVAPAAGVAWPADTVLALNGQAISAQEVEGVAAVFAAMLPQSSETHTRALALTNVVLPLHAARSIDPERRERARSEALAFLAAVRAGADARGPLVGPAQVERRGTCREIGVEAWQAAATLAPGEWSEVFETPGAFELVQLQKRGSEPVPAEVVLELGAVDFFYVEADSARQAIGKALDASKLVIVDPAWKDCVPTLWQHRLKAGVP